MQAILDLGTNTFHLLVARVNGNSITRIYEEQRPVMIGAGGIQHGIIAPDAYRRGMDALAHFHKVISDYGIEQVTATGTSAIRNATNGTAFLEEARQRFGFSVQYISGDTEATLIYKGVSCSMNLPDAPVLVMDIGGGSVEFILGKQSQILWKQSFEIGAARLLQQFSPSDPIKPTELAALETYLEQQLQDLHQALENSEQKPQLLIGSAGSFETLLDVLKHDLQEETLPVSAHAKQVEPAQVESFCQYMIHSSHAQRTQMKGLVDFRIDMIVVASALLHFVWNRHGFKQLLASDYALKEGLLFYNP